MSESHESSFLERAVELWHFVEILGLLFLGVLSWIGQKQIGRVDALEKKVNEQVALKSEVAEVKDSILNLDAKMSQQHAAITTRLDALLIKMLKD